MILYLHDSRCHHHLSKIILKSFVVYFLAGLHSYFTAEISTIAITGTPQAANVIHVSYHKHASIHLSFFDNNYHICVFL